MFYVIHFCSETAEDLINTSKEDLMTSLKKIEALPKFEVDNLREAIKIGEKEKIKDDINRLRITIQNKISGHFDAYKNM